MQILGSWQAVCQFDSLALVADFLVSDVPSGDVLLGFDFLSKYGAVVDLGNKTCRIMGKIFPLVDLNPTLEPQTVVVHSDTVVPPRSEAIISGMVQSVWGDYAEGMLEPSSALSKHCDLLVARVVCKVKKGALPIRVINVTNEALTLKRGMKVGTLFTDIEIDEVGGCKEEGESISQSWTVDSLMGLLGVGGTSAPESRRAGRSDFQPAVPPRRRRPEVQLGTSWVSYRHPNQSIPTGVRGSRGRQEALNPASEDVGGTQRGSSEAPSAAGMESPSGVTESGPGLQKQQFPGGVSSGERGCPARQQRPPVWSNDYQMSP
ncbi:hypothetical protein GBF38_001885 [Nibea albiflora]|uniref:Uncharacterized protein n=1 Tax=Nibea albiflora TaxID=240163 RepID=A0ACB7EDE8_NIBAL|nr:hypothetical protein GBF38_001885 [Nibea albiflora]